MVGIDGRRVNALRYVFRSFTVQRILRYARRSHVRLFTLIDMVGCAFWCEHAVSPCPLREASDGPTQFSRYTTLRSYAFFPGLIYPSTREHRSKPSVNLIMTTPVGDSTGLC